MSFLSKAIKGVKKIVKKNKKTIKHLGIGARVVGALVTRGKSEKVIGNLKGVGAAVTTYKKLRGGVDKLKKLAKSEAATILKGRIQRAAPVAIKRVAATAMPGGAKIRKATKAASKPRKKAAPKPKKAAGKKRTAPKGGKDFKALSASWKAAGKPGTWLDWVKSH